MYVTGALLLISGIAWLGVHYALGAGAGELPHPLEAWLMKLHGLAAMLGLFVLGAVAAAHVPRGWRISGRPHDRQSRRPSRRHHWALQRRTGVMLCALAAVLAFSGYLLYYFAPEWIHSSIGWAHAAAGVAMALVIALHRRGAERTHL